MMSVGAEAAKYLHCGVQNLQGQASSSKMYINLLNGISFSGVGRNSPNYCSS